MVKRVFGACLHATALTGDKTAPLSCRPRDQKVKHLCIIELEKDSLDINK